MVAPTVADRIHLYVSAAKCGEAKSRVDYVAKARFGLKSMDELTAHQCHELAWFYTINSPAKRRPRHWNLSEMYRADVSKQGYVRWPRWLAEVQLPAEWKAIDSKLWIFLVHKMNIEDPWGLHRVHWKEAREFLGGASKNDIKDSLCRLMDRYITITAPGDIFGEGSRLYPTFPVLMTEDRDGNRTGLWDQEAHWTLSQEVISELVEHEDGYARAKLKVVRQLESFGAIRLYLWARMMQNSMQDSINRVWKLDELAVFLGANPEIRTGNLKDRYIEPAIAQIKAAGAFNNESTCAYYDRAPNTRGHAITSVRFQFIKTLEDTRP